MRTSALLVVALVVLAGCGGQTGHETTTSPADSPSPSTSSADATTDRPATSTEPVQRIDVTEDGASLGDVNATLVWQRVGDLVSAGDVPPPVVVVEPRTTNRSVARSALPNFRAALGDSAAAYVLNETAPGGSYEPAHRVVLRRAPETSDEQMEALLAHEFAHAYQRNVDQKFPENAGTTATATVKEGAAEFVAWRYADRYMEGYDRERAMATIFEQAWAPQRIGLTPYVYGARYARNHSDPDAPLASMYDDPPTTAEQVLHGLPPGSEEPRTLAVHGETAREWAFDPTATERLGEAHLRFLLEIGVSRDRAAAAAAGWGNDRRMRFVSTEGYSYAWVVRWDTASDAREFEHAFAAYRQNVSVPLGVESVGDETTVVFAGSESFVANATATGTNANVTVAT